MGWLACAIPLREADVRGCVAPPSPFGLEEALSFSKLAALAKKNWRTR
jgi:hypothetical protein